MAVIDVAAPEGGAAHGCNRTRPRTGRSHRMSHEATLEKLKQRLGPDAFTTSEFRDNRRVHVPPVKLLDALQCLKTDCGFDYLADITAVDYLNYPNARDR